MNPADLLTLQLTQDEILRLLQAAKRDSDALLMKIEAQANAQILAAAARPTQPDVAARMSSSYSGKIETSPM